jgi:hypothetical protein
MSAWFAQPPGVYRKNSGLVRKSATTALLSFETARRDPDEFAMAVETALEGVFLQTLHGSATGN